ncbi:MAG: hypothetical protein LBO05_09250 [Deltaproteobacteria bacterium]|nr:hypothetical protein [Deltaproteobacteria bacterium]
MVQLIMFARDHKKRPLLPALLILAGLLALAAGCGVFADYARDNNLHVGSLGLKDFISPVRLRVGVLTFRDEVGLGTPEAGPNLARLVSDKFAENGDIVVVPPEEVLSAARARGWNGDPLTPELAMELGRELDLNVVMDGAISQIEEQSVRRGWRRIARFFTSRQQYVDTVLTLVAYDSATGLVISARAGESSYRVGKNDTDPFAPESRQALSQETIEESLDLAIEDTYYRTLDGLAYTPFKAMVVDVSGGTATIRYGLDVGLKRGQNFVSLSHWETLTSSIDIQYNVPGAAKARLTVLEVGPRSAELEITEGSLSRGDFIQSWND